VLTYLRRHPFRALIGIALLLFSLFALILPGLTIVRYAFFDSELGGPGPAQFAIDNHRAFSPRYAKYCRERVASGDAAHLDINDIAGTEWPLFGSAFYLWATENLQDAYEQDPSRFSAEPKVYAREAIEEATRLVIDPVHATWVRQHWGDDYLEKENCFYRALYISALTAHDRLIGGNATYRTQLVAQVESLTAELLASPSGAAFLAHMRQRLFREENRTPNGLLPYAADAVSGAPYDPSRGCGNSYIVSFAAKAWPQDGSAWMESYLDEFWQQNWLAAGFREFHRELGNETYFDVDAGPVVGGIGMSATTFGVMAARATGAHAHARVLETELITASWPLPNGVLFLPRVFSDGENAPYLGQCAILHQLSTPQVTEASPSDERLPTPWCVWLGVAAYFLVGGLFARLGWKTLRKPLRS